MNIKEIILEETYSSLALQQASFDLSKVSSLLQQTNYLNHQTNIERDALKQNKKKEQLEFTENMFERSKFKKTSEICLIIQIA